MLSVSWDLPSIADVIRDRLWTMHPQSRAALARRVVALGVAPYRPAQSEIVAFLLRSRFFRLAPSGVVVAALDPPSFAPAARFAGLAVPRLTTTGALAAWLVLSPEELDWFSDERHGQDQAGSPKLMHYRHVATHKRDGTIRLLEAPKARLKNIQRRILAEVLAPVPVHECAHGFVPGRSCLTGAQRHAGEVMVARFDLSAFFPSIAAPRVHGLFRALGYPWAVARRLTGLCTTVTPLDVIHRISAAPCDDAGLRSTHRMRHLPQGAPTSPALANLLAWRLDRRLHGLARAAGATYTRYADDLSFSGGEAFAGSLERFSRSVTSIVREEGFCLNTAKTRVMPRSGRQSVTGLVVNDHLNVSRAEFDTLKAILHRCGRGNPSDQNRASVPDFRRHLEGRIAWMAQVNPSRGRRLWVMFDSIEWGIAAPG